MPVPLPQAARKHYLWSAALVERALREANQARPAGIRAVVLAVARHQLAAAVQGQRAVGQMLAQQDVDVDAEGRLNAMAFTTPPDRLMGMLEQIRVDFEFDRIVSSLVSDAGRSAESVATTLRPGTGYVRYLSPPSCSRCAVLAGRVYRYSSSFLRHPGCDCVMVPTSVADPTFTQDPVSLMERGLVSGLSKADRKAIEDGADFNKVVNVRQQSAGLNSSGRAVARAGRPTPEAIYAEATSRDDAIERLTAAGYVR